MNDSRNEIASSENAAEECHVQENDTLPHVNSNENTTTTSPMPCVVKTTRPNSKLIRQNMEEVLSSVKKKHRQKHRLKKEQKKMALLEAEATASTTAATAPPAIATASPATVSSPPATENDGISSNVTPRTHKHVKGENKRHNRPLQEKMPHENDLNHTKTEQRKPNKRLPNRNLSLVIDQYEKEIKTTADVSTEEPMKAASTPKTKSVNAFEVMMNARNKSIGSNTPGKEAESSQERTTVNVKRKLLLTEWAERKGGLKRKLDEETRAAYVENELDYRAKRLKNMLTKTESPAAQSTPMEKQKENTEGRKTRKSSKATVEDTVNEKTTPTGGRQRKTKSSTSDVAAIDAPKDTPNPPLNTETVEFLSKLASPTKKRDSLLGYFPRKESPSDVTANAKTSNLSNAKEEIQESVKETAAPIEIPKMRTRRSTIKTVAADIKTEVLAKENVIEEQFKLQNNALTNTPNSRPRRSCAGKARYDYDLQVSPTKIEKKATKLATPRVNTKAIKQVEEDANGSVIVLDDSNTETDSPIKTLKKLAPLFVRAMPKPYLDPLLLKARQDFLMSGVPEKIRLENARQQQYRENFDRAIELFPRICHVQQFSVIELKYLEVDSRIKHALQNVTNEEANISLRQIEMCPKFGSITTCHLDDYVAADDMDHKSELYAENVPLPFVRRKRAITHLWKPEFDPFPVFKCYNQLRKKKHYFPRVCAEDTEQVTESIVVTTRTRRSNEAEEEFSSDSEEAIRPSKTALNGEMLFTEKYKPMLLKQVLFNEPPVLKLRRFLANWSNSNSNVDNARKSQTPDDSTDFANDSNSSQQIACNSVVLLGPVSSGKTNAVYALANEMNFSVLEINAGMKRTGKKLIQELQEATQSHHISKDSPSTKAVHGKSQKKVPLNGLKTKKKYTKKRTSAKRKTPNNELTQSARKSLILIEDADIVFEQYDAGFIDAIYTLAASSKRPVIVVASNPKCAHLQRLMLQNTIYFTVPAKEIVCKFLAVVSLVENCPVNPDDVMSLYMHNRYDMRKTTLQLQFFVQSGGDFERVVPPWMPTSPQKQEQQIVRRCPSVESDEMEESENDDEEESEEENNTTDSKSTSFYLHTTLFDYFTKVQNESDIVPFPVDFRLLRFNLGDYLKIGHTITMRVEKSSCTCINKINTRRRRLSPIRDLFNSATKTEKETENHADYFDDLCDLYENLSVATQLGTHAEDENEKLAMRSFIDCMIPNMGDYIAHALVEGAIDINLGADTKPYILYDSLPERLTLANHLSTTQLRTQRACALDYEPALRAICRAEEFRSVYNRRSRRFIHYLRGTTTRITPDIYVDVCDIMNEMPQE